MPRRYAARHLTPRDLALLRWVGSGHLAGETQLLRRFWPARCPATGQARLQQLVQAGVLTRHACDARRPGEVVYTLTPAGRLLFPPAERSALYAGLPAAGEIRQQLVAQDAYLHLAAAAVAAGGHLVAWRGERALRSAGQRAPHRTPRQTPAPPRPEIPDAQAVLAGADGRLTTWDIEIDGQYHGQMLRAKLARFGAGGRPTLWVCTSAARAAHIRQAATPYPHITVLTLT